MGERGGRHHPDFDAVSLRNQPNSTARALQREALGSKMRIVSAHQPPRARSAPRGRPDHLLENEAPDWGDDVSVIRVRDPQRQGSAPHVRPQSAGAKLGHIAANKVPFQERGNIIVRVRLLSEIDTVHVFFLKQLNDLSLFPISSGTLAWQTCWNSPNGCGIQARSCCGAGSTAASRAAGSIKDQAQGNQVSVALLDTVCLTRFPLAVKSIPGLHMTMQWCMITALLYVSILCL